MNKLSMAGMALLLLLAVSCKKDNKNEIENAGSGFRAIVENHGGDSKIHLNEDLSVEWDNGDAILVKSQSYPRPKRFTTTGSGTTVDFETATSLPPNFYEPPYTAYYPVGNATSGFEGDQLTLPATQTYFTATSFANGVNPMMAQSTSTLLLFKNVCGVLKLKLHSTEAYNVDNITITSNTGEKLWGTGTVTFADDIPSLGTLSDGGSTLTLDCGGIAMSTRSTEPSVFHFVVPVNTLGTSFTVTVNATNGKKWIKTANSSQNKIVRSKITALPEQAAILIEPVTPKLVTITAGCQTASSYFQLDGQVTVPQIGCNCEYGIVYSTVNNMPTIDDTKVIVNTETFDKTVKSFTFDLPNLGEGISFWVRTYAIIEGVKYSNNAVKMESGEHPFYNNWEGGMSPFPFAIDFGADEVFGGEDDKQVYFSKGNLQYRAKGGLGGDAENTVPSSANVGGTWRFADYQSDIRNNANKSANYDYPGWIDLFGWATSGNNHNGLSYQPWKSNEYHTQYLAYGGTNYSFEQEGQSGMADWGRANSIYDGETPTNGWRTLSNSEWKCIFDRKGEDEKFLWGKGKIGNCTNGLIILPDNWKWEGAVASFAASWKPGPQNDYKNTYSYSEWKTMEAAGAVFLPAAGYRDPGTSPSMEGVGNSGYYWTSTHSMTNYANSIKFLKTSFTYGSEKSYKSQANSVRLVKNAN